MDRNAFKRRMQALKSYRESNPGKGYWDWKVQSFEDGGEASREQQAIQNALNAKGTPNQFMDTWNQARLATGNFNDQLGDGKLELQKANRDATAIYKSPITYGFNSYLRGTPVMKSATMTEQEAIQRHIQDAKRFGIGTKVRMQNPDQKGLVGTQTIAGEYSPKGKAIYASTENVLTHEQAHASNAYPQENRIQEILGGQNKATTTESTKRHMDGGEFPKMGEYEYQYDINGVPYGTTIHEMNHNADYLKNKAIDADANSNLYYWMRSALKPFSRIDPNTDKLTKYYNKPTEQKAYMNQLREFMYANKMIDTRDQIVTPDLIKQAISKLPKGMQSIKKASEQFKSMRSYTKWFNTIPLLGVGAVGANKYFTSNENRD